MVFFSLGRRSLSATYLARKNILYWQTKKSCHENEKVLVTSRENRFPLRHLFQEARGGLLNCLSVSVYQIVFCDDLFSVFIKVVFVSYPPMLEKGRR